MRKLFVVLALFILFTPVASAQEKGEGVGALATRPNGEAITISEGRTARWAEVIVENEAGELQAVAELDSKGLINFTFLTDSSNIGGLYIYAVDEAGFTNKLQFTGTNLSSFILPPTIVGEDDENLPDNYLKVSGYTYPSSEISLHLTSDDGFDETYTTQADESEGRWEMVVEELPGGSYTAVAQASIEGLTSQDSQEVTFEIEGPAEDIATNITKIVQNVTKNITERVKQLPEPVKETSNTVSKVGVPATSSWALLQIITSGMGLKDLFTYMSLFYFWLVGLFKRKKREEWGIIYDSITKNPLPATIVRLYSGEEELVETDVTGQSGTFSFLPEPGNYRLEVTKPGYIFPTKIIRGNVDGEYTNIYSGGIFNVDEDNPVVDLSVPIDPRAYEKIRDLRLKLRLFFSRYSQTLAAIFFIPGFIFSAITYINTSTTVNLIILLFYIGSIFLYAIRAFRRTRLWGIVTDEKGNPLPNVSLSLLDTLLGRQLQRRVTDLSGRYQFLAPKGAYRIAITTENYEISPKSKYKGDAVRVEKERGVVKPKIKVRKV